MNWQAECYIHSILSENFHAGRNLRSFILTSNFVEENIEV